MLMLHQEVACVLEVMHEKGGVFKYPKVFNVIMGLSLRVMCQSCLKIQCLYSKNNNKIQAYSHSFYGGL